MAHLLVECARDDLRVIAFCKTKKLCELVLRYARELLANSNGTQFLETLRAYRGGYTAGDRRATESALFDGLCAPSPRPTRWSWAWTSACWTRRCTWGSPARRPH